MEVRVCISGSMPFVGMVMAVLAQVTDMMVTKLVISQGMSTFVLAVYSGGFSSLVLLPYAFFFHCTVGSEHPPLSFSILSRIFLIAFTGTVALISGYIGLQYSSPTLGTAMLNLVPAFTFILVIIFRMEKLDWKSSSTRAKSVGTLVLVGGAFIVTFYKGPPIAITSLLSGSPYQLLSPQSNWILGGFLLACQSFSISLWYILQTATLKKFPAELMIVFYNCCFVTIQSAVVAVIADRDPISWRLGLDMRLIGVAYIAVIGTAFRISVTTWCLGKTGPLFVSMFKPLAIVAADALGVIFLGDVLYVGSLIGALVIVTGFYTVMWGKAKEENVREDGGVQSLESSSSNVPLLQKRIGEI